jgi:hypothetical protein
MMDIQKNVPKYRLLPLPFLDTASMAPQAWYLTGFFGFVFKGACWYEEVQIASMATDSCTAVNFGDYSEILATGLLL